MRTLTSARVYLARGQCSIRFGRVLFTIGRTAAAFSDNPMVKPSAVHLPFGPVLLPGYVPRIICLFRSPHTSSPPEPFPACVSPASPAPTSGRVYKHGRERRNAQKSRKVRETASTMPFALPISGSYISQDNGINLNL
ncbi:hypothetical protein ALC57_14620 [Trachymyrmex cornetzi]|uniref:Uncharacterized protein n=1 Tax=Trachymyrmex cornetzi TaxID=471704 RepID=A0A151IY54_9HYME|nr:hypothetical protein ALC57_14620 [Trachymyrmex cornetzi]